MNNILYITPLFPQQRVIKTIDLLLRNGCNVRVLTFDLDNSKLNVFSDFSSEALKITSLRLKGKMKLMPFKSIVFKKKLKDILSEEYNAIIFRDIFTFKIAKYLKHKCKSNSKLIMDVADNYPEVTINRFKFHFLSKFFSRSLNKLERTAVQTADEVFTVTENSMYLLRFKHNIDIEKITVVKNYPDLKSIYKKQVSERKINRNHLVYIGTVDESVRNISEVFAFIKDTKYQLDIYSFNKDKVENLIHEYDVNDNVKYFEPINRKDLVKVIEKYSIGIIPHKIIEGTKYTIPNKLYDYIHSNLPILATNNDAMAKEVKALGVGEVYHNQKDFFDKIHYLENNRESFISNINKAKSHCVWEKQARYIMEAINR